jgi:hypothetical protein
VGDVTADYLKVWSDIEAELQEIYLPRPVT